MSDTDRERRYSDREAKALIARAVELSRPKAEEKRGEGASLSEIERIAAEAGLDPSAVRLAAAELDAKAKPLAASLFGPLKLSDGATVPRAPTSGEMELLLMDMPDLAGISGSGSAAGGGLVWRSDSAAEMQTGRKVRVEIRPLDRSGGSGAIVEARNDLSSAAGGLFGGIVGGMGLGVGLPVGLSVGLGALHSPLFAIAFPLGAIALSFGLARLIMSVIIANSRHKAAAIVEAISSRLGAESGPKE